ncbi:MAG: hypothetical protein ACYCS8_17235 [Acidithiobacillus sp.]
MHSTPSVTNTPADLIAGRKYTFHHDAGHGWLEVNRSDLVALNIADKITPYSYQKGVLVFLEEDCDMATFICAYEERFGVETTWGDLANDVFEGNDSPIRGYAPYQPS